jgi:hypothetical protein
MSVLYFETFGKPAAGVAGAERFHLLRVVNEAGLNLGAPEAPYYELLNVAAANACLAHGPDALRLAARLAAQAEIWCWVDGPNRSWLARLIGEGLEAGYFQPLMGWESAQALLLQSEEAPVFVSTSVTGRMPCTVLAVRAGDVIGEELEELPPYEQWALAEAYLRRESAQEDEAAHSEELHAPFSREMRPRNWSEYFYAT